MGKKEIILSIILIIISIVFFSLTFQFPHQTVALAPTAFPRFVSVSLMILSLILLIQGVKGITKDASRESKEKLKLNKVFIFKLILMISLAFLYTRFITKLGYLYTTPLFVAGNMVLFKEKRIIRILVVSITTTIVLYVVFKMVFKIPLPRFALF
ncbi:MAG: tripartite tricarboxylate transporter TctB family protein [Candidatus Atribacteria bacterium]|nr:tripartite tricarboxylate transporter TctB family protein [Candidatus Atribacteria bacterium]